MVIPCCVPRIISLTTDFGLADGYVGVMQGVILGIAPEVRIVDISHEVRPQDVLDGAFLLLSSYRYFPEDTIHVAIVDPGVGTSRKPVAVATPHGTFVAPDNGVLAPVLAREGVVGLETGVVTGELAVEISNPRFRLSPVSNTFHGRDIFAPAAAYLAQGVALSDLGPHLHRVATAEYPEFRRDAEGLRGQIVHIDHFGNAISNIPASQAPVGAVVRAGGRPIGPLTSTYQEAQIVALEGSTGLIEIAVRNGSASRVLDLAVGDTVEVSVP